MASETAPSSWDGQSRWDSDNGTLPDELVEEQSEEKDQQFELVD